MTNAMKAMIHAGRPALACSLMFPSSQLVEMLGCAGFDWVALAGLDRSLRSRPTTILAWQSGNTTHARISDARSPALTPSPIRS